MKPESDDSNPINSLYDMRLILIITIYHKDIYTFCIFSEYNGRKDPTRDEIPKLIPFHSTVKYSPKNHSFKNQYNDANDFQS